MSEYAVLTVPSYTVSILFLIIRPLWVATNERDDEGGNNGGETYTVTQLYMLSF